MDSGVPHCWYSKKIDSQIQLGVDGKKYLVKVKEMETFRIFETKIQENSPASKVEDDELDGDKDDSMEEEDKSDDDMAIQKNLDGDKNASMEGGRGKMLEHAEGNNEGRQEAVNKQVKEAAVKEAIVIMNESTSDLEINDQLSFVPTKYKPEDIEKEEAFIEVNSNTSFGLDSYVEDSGGLIIKETRFIKSPLQLKAQDDEAQSKVRLKYGMQQKVAGENGLAKENILKEIEKNILLQDGLVLLGSNNDIHMSQIPSINLQVELNPREARKALRTRISQSCMNNGGSISAENIIGTSESQGYQQNSILQELYSSTVAGDKLGIIYSDQDIRHMKKLIEADTNRFTPLSRSNSKH